MDCFDGVIRKLNKNYGLKLTQEELTKRLMCISTITICTKLCLFQFKLLLNAILTNVRLKHMKIKSSDKCDFCGTETETLSHFFFNCEYIKQLWKYVSELLQVKLNLINIITNEAVESPRQVKNVIILIVKYHIFAMKCSGNIPSVNSVKKAIVKHHDIEYELAKEKGKLGQHEHKWSHITM